MRLSGGRWVASELIVDAAKVRARQVLLLPARASLEHLLVQHLVVFLCVASRQSRARPNCAELLTCEVNSVRLPERVVKVTDAITLAEADTSSFTIIAFGSLIGITTRVAWDGKGLAHDRRF